MEKITEIDDLISGLDAEDEKAQNLEKIDGLADERGSILQELAKGEPPATEEPVDDFEDPPAFELWVNPKLRDLGGLAEPPKPDDDSPTEEPDTEADVDVAVDGEIGGGDQTDTGEGQQDADSDDNFVVSFTSSHVNIKATRDVDLELSGDVRDGKVSLKAGKSTRRKLTGEGNGWVGVNGTEYEVP